MAVYKRTYKVYDGPLTASWSRFTVLTRYSLGTLFKSRLFTGYFVLCFIPFLIAVTYIYFAHSQTAQMLLGIQSKGEWDVSNVWFAFILQAQTTMGFILVLVAAPGVTTRDFANDALQLYFSRPLSRTEYVLGKISVLALLLSVITWIPGLILFGLQAQMEGNGWGWNNLYIAGAIFVSSWLWIAVFSLLALAVSVFVRWRLAAAGVIFGVLLVLPGLGEAFNATLRTNWGRLLDLFYTIRLVWAQLFRIKPRALGVILRGDIPLWAAWATIFMACLISVLLLNRRLKAREVVSG